MTRFAGAKVREIAHEKTTSRSNSIRTSCLSCHSSIMHFMRPFGFLVGSQDFGNFGNQVVAGLSPLMINGTEGLHKVSREPSPNFGWPMD